jgi:hypothetical protein
MSDHTLYIMGWEKVFQMVNLQSEMETMLTASLVSLDNIDSRRF